MISRQSFGYDTNYPDRLTSFGGTSINYNALGCPTTVNGYTATWTRGKLSKLTNGSRITGTHTYNYTYNAFGQRIGTNYTYVAGTSSSSAVVIGMLTGYSLTFCYDQSGRLSSPHYARYRKRYVNLAPYGTRLIRTSRPIKKPPDWVVFLLAEKKGFEPSRRLPDLHP